MALQNKKTKSIKKPLVAAAIVGAVLVVSFGLYAYAFDQWPFAGNSNTSTESSSSNEPSDQKFIDDQPATDEDQELANKKKQQAYEQQQSSEKSSAGRSSASQQKVDVTLTTFYKDDGALHANGFVAGVIENGGTCTLVLTNESGKSVSVSREGHVNATNTTCGQSTIELSKLTPGKWTPELRYSSDTSKGTTGPNAWDPIEVN